jgi:hypothetical protein
LPAETVLTLKTDVSSSGHAARLVNSSPVDFTTVAVSSTVALGPFSEERTYRITSDKGRIEVSQAPDKFGPQANVENFLTAEDLEDVLTTDDINTDDTFAEAKDTEVPSALAVKTYVDTEVAAVEGGDGAVPVLGAVTFSYLSSSVSILGGYNIDSVTFIVSSPANKFVVTWDTATVPTNSALSGVTAKPYIIQREGATTSTVELKFTTDSGTNPDEDVGHISLIAHGLEAPE